MKYEINIKYDRKTIINGAKIFWKLKHKNDRLISPILLAIIIWGVIGSEVNDVFKGISITIGFIYSLLVYGLGYYIPYKSATVWKKAGLIFCKWTFNETILCSSSGVGDMTISWNNVKELWITENYWFLVYSSGSNTSLPVFDVLNEVKNFIKKQVSKNGGKIINSL